MTIRIILQILILPALLLVLLANETLALEVHNVRFGQHNGKTRLVLDLDKSADFRAFVLDNPYRMVIDLPSFNWNANTIPDQSAAGVTAVRHGNLQPGISRIVFDLNRAIGIEAAFILPAGQGKPDRLVIDFATIAANQFAQTKSNVFGKLDPAQSPPPPSTTMENMSASGIPLPATKPQLNQASPQNQGKKPLIVIDAGHGGVDPGAISKNGLREKDVVLALAKALRDELLASGQYRVHMTRDSDIFIKLAGRVKIARQQEGDLFISIHADSMPNDSSVSGTSIYTLSETASDAQSAALAARENKADLIAGIDLNVEDEEVANILVDLAMRDTMNQSKFFANKLVGVLPGDGLKLLVRPHRSAGFAVLKAPDVPSVLIEAGFMSNEHEARQINTVEYRRKFATALRRGIDAYFERVRKNQRI